MHFCSSHWYKHTDLQAVEKVSLQGQTRNTLGTKIHLSLLKRGKKTNREAGCCLSVFTIFTSLPVPMPFRAQKLFQCLDESAGRGINDLKASLLDFIQSFGIIILLQISALLLSKDWGKTHPPQKISSGPQHYLTSEPQKTSRHIAAESLCGPSAPKMF